MGDTTLEIAMASVKALVQQKDEMEQEIEQIRQTLQLTDVGISGSVLDSDGYPRDDIDIPMVREHRNRLACLQTDHRELMIRIDIEIQQLHALARKQKEEERERRQQRGEPELEPSPLLTEEAMLRQRYAGLIPFSEVGQVSIGSPSYESGMQLGDQVIKFASVTHRHPGGMSAIAEVTRNSVDKTIEIVVLRQDKIKVLSLTPRAWSGRGLLGCMFQSIKK